MRSFLRAQIILVLCFSVHAYSQKQITLEDCFTKFKFYPNSVEGFRWMKDGVHYTRLENDVITRYSANPKEKPVVFAQLKGVPGASDYEISDNEQTVLALTQKEQIYRHSFNAHYYASLNKGKDWIRVGGADAVLQHCALSPDGLTALFVRDNNLYLHNLSNKTITQVTTDGVYNQIINGRPDWLYEEEFNPVNGDGFKAAIWSDDGTKVAYLRFDERAVEEMSLTYFTSDLYPAQVKYKYPKVGTSNAKVTAYVYDVRTQSTTEIETGSNTDHYLPRIYWTPDRKVVVMRLNRHQDSLQLLIADPYKAPTSSNKLATSVLLTETDSAYVEVDRADFLTFLADKQHFIWSSERSGTHQLYLYDMSGKLVRKLTEGREEITDFYGIDEKNKLLYVQTTYAPQMRMVWEVPFEKGEARILSGESEGFHEAGFSPTFDYHVLKTQSHNSPPVYTLRKRNSEVVTTLLDNKRVAELRKEYGFTEKEMFQIPVANNIKLNCWVIKPPDYSEKKKYPVLIDIYGGPGSQTVTLEYNGYTEPWHQMLAQKGYVIISMDNRGTGGRGRAFKKATHMQLGKLETQDQIALARHLGAISWIDKERIGIWGWSFGGFLSTNALLKGEGFFKLAVAVAPVTNWKWYDTAYTERFLHTYAENPKGYDENSPINYADKLNGKYLLCHGMADDNVHWQHSVALADALIKAGKQFETYYYPNRDHGISGDGATLHLFTKITDFILKNL